MVVVNNAISKAGAFIRVSRILFLSNGIYWNDDHQYYINIKDTIF